MLHNRLRAAVDPILRWIERLSLQKRLVISYIVVLLIPSIVVSLILFNQFYDGLIQDAMKNNRMLLETEQIYINNQIETLERAAQLAVADKDIINYLLSSDEPLTNELIEFNMNAYANLMRIQYNNPNIEHLRLFTDNPYSYEIWPIIFQEERIAQQSWYQTVKDLNGQELWHFDRDDLDIMQRYTNEIRENKPKISLLREINILKEKHAGIIQVDMLLSQFSPKTFGAIQNNSSQQFLLEYRGELLTNSQPSFLTANELSNDEIIKQMHMQAEQEGEDFVRFTYKEKPYLLVYTPIKRLDANLLSVVSLETVFQHISQIRNTIIIANILLIMLLSMTNYYINSFILKKLHLLTEAIKKVRKGQFQIDFRIKGGGEVGVLAFHFQKMLNTINELIAQAVRKQALTKEAELKTLRNQIDSHFLYNTLENIKMLAEMENKPEISDALTSLGGMMRYNFKWTGEYVKLKDEIRHITNYIGVMNVRFDEPITLQLDVPIDLEEQEVLKMSLQPIVENAVKHAWSGSSGFSDRRIVSIQAYEDAAQSVIVAVSDNGEGMAPERLNQLNGILQFGEHTIPEDKKPGIMDNADEIGIGLRNVQERIRLFYGREYGIEVHSEPGAYTTVYMRLPRVVLSGGGPDRAKALDRG